jgi:hypothetical protein
VRVRVRVCVCVCVRVKGICELSSKTIWGGPFNGGCVRYLSRVNREEVEGVTMKDRKLPLAAGCLFTHRTGNRPET